MGIQRNHQAEYRHWQPEMTKIIDGRAVRFRDICVYEFSVSDVEDPDLYAAQPIWEWQESDAGKWVMANAVESPYWIKSIDYNIWGQRFKIMARLSEQNETFFRLTYR